MKSATAGYLTRDLEEMEQGEGLHRYFRSELGTGIARGKGASALGLSFVNANIFNALLLGSGPEKQSLRQNAGRGDDAAWDLTVSWDKSVSLAYVLGDEQAKERIKEGCNATIDKVVEQLEKHAITRRGKGGINHEGVEGLVVVPFWHLTSRYGPDPQLHCHLVVMNACLRQDGTWGALHSYSLYKTKKAISRLATAEDSSNWVAEGLRIQPTEHGARIADIPMALCEEASSGSKAIRAEAKRLGVMSPRDLEKINLGLRPAKKDFDLEVLQERWETLGAEFNIEAHTISAMFEKPQVQKLDTRRSAARRAAREAISEIEVVSSTFSKLELTSRTAHACRDGRANMDDIDRAVKHVLANDSRVTVIGEERGQTIYATHRTARHEKQALLTAKQSRQNRDHVLSGRHIQKAIERTQLDPEQARALRMSCGTKGAIKLIAGAAGTGKTRTLDAVRIAEESAGRRVIGSAPTGVARQELESGAHITESYTVAKLLLLLNPSFGYRTTHTIKMLGRAALKRPTWQAQKLRLGKKVTLVVDEAAMVGFRDMARIVQACKRSGAKLILCGDDRQLGPVLSGASLFTALRRRLGEALLTRNWRQRQKPWMQELNQMLADRDGESALRLLLAKDRLHVSRDSNSPLEACADYYLNHSLGSEKDSLVIASTRAQVQALNDLIQSARRAAGKLGESVTIHDDLPGFPERTIHVGDRVVLRRNSRDVTLSLGKTRPHFSQTDDMGVLNGDFGDVVSIRNKWMSVRLDRKHTSGKNLFAKINLRNYSSVQAGYAVTATRAQGKTVSQVLMLADSAFLDGEQGYVAMTRQAEDIQVFTHELSLGEDLRDMTSSLNRSRLQELPEEARHRLDQEEEAAERNQAQKLAPNSLRLEQGY